MGSRRNTRRVTGARPGGFILIQRCTTHDRLRFRGPQHHAPQSGTRRVPALRFHGIMKPFSALSSKLKIIRATASAHSSTSSALPSVATKIDQYPYASLRLRSNVVIGNTRAGRVPPPPQPCFARVLPINAKGFTGSICPNLGKLLPEASRRPAERHGRHPTPCIEKSVAQKRNHFDSWMRCVARSVPAAHPG